MNIPKIIIFWGGKGQGVSSLAAFPTHLLGQRIKRHACGAGDVGGKAGGGRGEEGAISR